MTTEKVAPGEIATPGYRAEGRKILNIGECELFQRRDSLGWKTSVMGEVKEIACAHLRLLADDEGEIITCKDCGRTVSAYWAFMRFSREYNRFKDDLESKRNLLIEDLKRGVILRAAQKVERAWRRRKMAPTCPHCGKAILPTDGFGNSYVRKIHALDA